MGIGNHEKPNKGKTDVWLTPLEIIHNLGGNFDLDPCGEEHHKTAKTIYSSGGLEKEWFGTVWLNPPYSQVELWVDKLIKHGNGIALVFARTDTKWAQRALKSCTSVFFLKKRIMFLNRDLSKPKWTSGAPSMFLAFGNSSFRNFEGVHLVKT